MEESLSWWELCLILSGGYERSFGEAVFILWRALDLLGLAISFLFLFYVTVDDYNGAAKIYSRLDRY